jgi:hypothetical protein
MDKDQLLAHLKNASKQGFVSKFERETFCKLNEFGEREGYRLFLRGFTMYEIKAYLIG